MYRLTLDTPLFLCKLHLCETGKTDLDWLFRPTVYVQISPFATNARHSERGLCVFICMTRRSSIYLLIRFEITWLVRLGMCVFACYCVKSVDDTLGQNVQYLRRDRSTGYSLPETNTKRNMRFTFEGALKSAWVLLDCLLNWFGSCLSYLALSLSLFCSLFS